MTASAEQLSGVRADARPETLLRAIAFIETHPHGGIAMSDIAEACSVTERAVQLAFRRHLDTTPTAHERRVRLARAREELAAADSDHASVTEVAARWGFFNAGRFAAAYRAAYGELPRDTLWDD